MLVQYLKEADYDRLLRSIFENTRWYNSSSNNPDEIGLLPGCIEASSIDLPSFKLVIPPCDADNDEKNENDIVNIKIVYSNWKELTPLQARNKYLWTYYCHHNIEYVRARWKDGDFTDSQVRDRFFVTGARRNLVRGNALSSLWWKGHLTYDTENENNPFWLTEVLGTTTNFADFLDTFNSSNPVRAKGVIKAIAEVCDEAGLEKLPNKVFRKLNRYLNRYSVVAPLDYLDEDEVQHLAKRELLRLVHCGAGS